MWSRSLTKVQMKVNMFLLLLALTKCGLRLNARQTINYLNILYDGQSYRVAVASREIALAITTSLAIGPVPCWSYHPAKAIAFITAHDAIEIAYSLFFT